VILTICGFHHPHDSQEIYSLFDVPSRRSIQQKLLVTVTNIVCLNIRVIDCRISFFIILNGKIDVWHLRHIFPYRGFG
jgi:hypothetical protein